MGVNLLCWQDHVRSECLARDAIDSDADSPTTKDGIGRRKGSGYWLGTNRFTVASRGDSVSQAEDLAIMRGGFLY